MDIIFSDEQYLDIRTILDNIEHGIILQTDYDVLANQILSASVSIQRNLPLAEIVVFQLCSEIQYHSRFHAYRAKDYAVAALEMHIATLAYQQAIRNAAEGSARYDLYANKTTELVTKNDVRKATYAVLETVWGGTNDVSA